MTVREAIAEDFAKLESFLHKHSATTMFMRGNLRDHGIGNCEHDYAMRYFIEERDEKIIGVGAIANIGSLMVQAPEGVENIAAYMKSAIPSDKIFLAMLGVSDQIADMRDAMGLNDLPTQMDEVEPLFTLDLDKLVVPDAFGAIARKPDEKDAPLLADWAYQYLVETGLHPAGEKTRKEAEKMANDRNNDKKFRLLVVDGKTVARTGFNTSLPDSVQVGGVFTPPEYRGRGYARLALALHLEEVRKQGVETAILFSANEYASRAYRAIGFEQIGHYTLTMFVQPDTKDK